MAKSTAAPKTFEAAISELETIVREMEDGSLSLEHALERYQRGTGLLKYCQQTLQTAEQRISQLENDTLTPIAGTSNESKA